MNKEYSSLFMYLIPMAISDAEKQLMFFPTIVTENMTVTKMRVHLG